MIQVLKEGRVWCAGFVQLDEEPERYECGQCVAVVCKVAEVNFPAAIEDLKTTQSKPYKSHTSSRYTQVLIHKLPVRVTIVFNMWDLETALCALKR